MLYFALFRLCWQCIFQTRGSDSFDSNNSSPSENFSSGYVHEETCPTTNFRALWIFLMYGECIDQIWIFLTKLRLFNFLTCSFSDLLRILGIWCRIIRLHMHLSPVRYVNFNDYLYHSFTYIIKNRFFSEYVWNNSFISEPVIQNFQFS